MSNLPNAPIYKRKPMTSASLAEAKKFGRGPHEDDDANKPTSDRTMKSGPGRAAGKLPGKSLGG